jgi:hypothetical protein
MNPITVPEDINYDRPPLSWHSGQVFRCISFGEGWQCECTVYSGGELARRR